MSLVPGFERALTPKKVSIFGFAFSRQTAGVPWFGYPDFEREMRRPSVRPEDVPSGSLFSSIKSQYTESGHLAARELEDEEKASYGRTTMSLVSITEPGVDLLVKSLVYRTTHLGDDLTSLMLGHDGIVLDIFRETDFHTKLMSEICGSQTWEALQKRLAVD